MASYNPPLKNLSTYVPQYWTYTETTTANAKPSGTSSDVQFNKGGSFGSDSNKFYYVDSTDTLNVPNIDVSTSIIARGLPNATKTSTLYYDTTTKAVSYGALSSSAVGSSGAVQLSNGSNGLTSNSNLSYSGNRLNAYSISAIQGESQFANGNYSDPDAGSSRALKVSGDGLAVSGGIKTDTLNSTIGEVYFNGANWLSTDTLYFPSINSRACIYCDRGSVSGVTSYTYPVPVRNQQQFLFGISNTTRANWSHCVGWVFNTSGGPALLTNGTVPKLQGGTTSFAGQTYPAVNITSLESGKTYKFECWIFELPDV